MKFKKGRVNKMIAIQNRATLERLPEGKLLDCYKEMMNREDKPQIVDYER